MASYTKKFSYAVVASGLALMGCRGPAGKDGQPGQTGPTGTPPTFTIDSYDCGDYVDSTPPSIVMLYLSISNTSPNPINCSLIGNINPSDGFTEGVCTTDTIETTLPFAADSTGNFLYGGCLYGGTTSDTVVMNFVVSCTDNTGLTSVQTYLISSCTPGG